MNFKVELDNIDYSDKRLIKALDNISDSIQYKIVIETDEVVDILDAYLKEVLEVDLDASNMYMDINEDRLYYDNIFEASVIVNQLLNHFGTGSISVGGEAEINDYYNINVCTFMRKLAKFALIQRCGDKVVLYFDQADEFTDTWIYKYLQRNKED